MKQAKWVLLSQFFLALVFAAFAVGQSTPATNPSSEPAPKLSHFDPALADPSLAPCDDFYKFACSKWISANPIPPDQLSWGTGSGLGYWNDNILRETMQKAAAKSGSRADYEQKIGDYWTACMKEDDQGNAASSSHELKSDLDRISRMKEKKQLAETVAYLHKSIPAAWSGDDNQTAAALFGFGQIQDLDDSTKVVAFIDQGGLALPNRDFYLKGDAKSADIRKKYQAHITKMLQLAGDSESAAAREANAVLAIETELAQAQTDNVSRRDPRNLNNKMSLMEFEALSPSFAWPRYLELVGAPESKPHYLVSSPKFFRALETTIQQHSLDDLKAYLRWHLVHGSAPYLSKSFDDENFSFFRATLLGAKQQLPRWRRCVRNADRDMGEALGRGYVAVAFPPENKQRILSLVHDLETALDQDITDVQWMQPATKEQAKAKLRSIQEKIGYPDHWRDYSSMTISSASYLANVHAATTFEFRRQLNKIGKPVDRTEWGITPSTIDAYYDPQLNTINFPAGILQPPLFEASKEDAVNYGAIGAVIGHEITHGFDDEGRKFDGNGNLRDWWTPADAKAYDERGSCIAQEYTQDVPEAGVKQDGHLTQGEDTADNGGVHIALLALENKFKAEGKSLDDKDADGFTPRQKFFLSYATAWCRNIRPETIRTAVLTNPHSIARFRVNNVLSNMPEFQQAYSCKTDAAMVHQNRCRVW
jgi:putative endopeptidase